jgi:2-polyprenyl-3-methyl-5-hydroxy-6-metoxy-1,4-benzoquinol methylase
MDARCNLCGSRDHKDDHLVSGRLRYARCSHCGLYFQHPMMDRETLRAIYQNYFGSQGQCYGVKYGYADYEAERSPETFRRHYLRWLSCFITDKRPILDFGCGTGNLLLLLRELGYEAEGCEFSDEAIAILTRTGLPFWRYEDLDKVGKHRYGYVTMIDTLEHLFDPAGDLRMINELLVDGGLLFIETPNSDDLFVRYYYKGRWHGISPVHLYLFGKRTVALLLEKSGFSLVSLSTFQMTGPVSARVVRQFQYVAARVALLVGGRRERVLGQRVERLRMFVDSYNKSGYQWTLGDGLRVVARKIGEGRQCG